MTMARNTIVLACCAVMGERLKIRFACRSRVKSELLSYQVHKQSRPLSLGKMYIAVSRDQVVRLCPLAVTSRAMCCPNLALQIGPRDAELRIQGSGFRMASRRAVSCLMPGVYRDLPLECSLFADHGGERSA
jgi:hypothetical protein